MTSILDDLERQYEQLSPTTRHQMFRHMASACRQAAISGGEYEFATLAHVRKILERRWEDEDETRDAQVEAEAAEDVREREGQAEGEEEAGVLRGD